jgi:hypothetical protein
LRRDGNKSVRAPCRHWGGHHRVLSTDATTLAAVQAALNPGRAGLLRAQVAQDVGRIDITYLGPADLSGA